jgi:hypothetical protein
MIKRLFLMVVLVLATAFSVVVTNTGGFFDIFGPFPTEATVTALPTDMTATPEVTLEPPVDVPTATLEPTIEVIPTETSTLVPTATLEPTATLPPPTPTATAVPLPTTTAVPFQVQRMTPIYMTNFVHTDAACNWQGVAGQVFDSNDTPILNYIVKITGIYNSQPVSLVGITGMITGLPYGPGSYEIVLGATPLDSVDTLSAQLFDNAGNPITDPLAFSTSKDCNKNLVIINFQKK